MKRNKILLLVSSLATLALLAGAAWQENVAREWRRLQRQYLSRIPGENAAEFAVQLRQVVVPGLGATDRCVACHLGMAAGEAGIAGDRVFGKHPDVVHDPAEFGCVVCHGGQGRATDRADAHGEVPHWPEPMIPREFAWAGCGSCHTHPAIPDRATLARGASLFERHDCAACHALEGKGGTFRPGAPKPPDGTLAPDLSRVGARGFDPGWHARHAGQRAAAAPGSWWAGFGPVEPGDQAAIEAFLRTRIGAPGLVESKAAFQSLGCRGCHKVGGVGGDDGPDLTRVGGKDPGRLDFTRVPGPRTLAGFFAEHFRAPATVVPGSAMPVLGLGEDEIRLLTFYMLSLRRTDLPEAYWPKDRIRAERFGDREFAADGRSIWGSFCAACHGPGGEGMRYPGLPAFPSVGNPDYLAVASDAFIAETIRRGRPGRRMPAWGEKEGGLRPAEIDEVVRHIRSMGGGVTALDDGRPARWIAADAEDGGRLYAANCSVCHGADGGGKEGTSLSNPVLLGSATDTYLLETIRRGRRGTAMPSFAVSSTTHRALDEDEMRSIVAFLRTWEAKR